MKVRIHYKHDHPDTPGPFVVAVGSSELARCETFELAMVAASTRAPGGPVVRSPGGGGPSG